MKKIETEVINTQYDNYDKQSLYERIKQLKNEFGYKSIFDFSGDRLIYNLIHRKALPHFKTIFTLRYVCELNGKHLDLNWLLFGEKIKSYSTEEKHTGVVEELKVEYMSQHMEQLKQSILTLRETIEAKDKLLSIYEEKLSLNK